MKTMFLSERAAHGSSGVFPSTPRQPVGLHLTFTLSILDINAVLVTAYAW